MTWRAACLLGALCVAAAGQANAACGLPAGFQLKHKAAYSGSAFDPGLIETVGYNSHSMVGMWKVSFVSQGQQIDFGYAQWHSDGTEFLNSGGRAPVTQNYCLGVWKQTGAASYKLNHWAISYDDQGNHNADVNIKEQVKLGKGSDVFAGTFAIQAYDPVTGDPLGPEVDGTITGTRVLVQ